MSDNFRKTNANNQSTNNDENKNDEVSILKKKIISLIPLIRY